MSKGQSDGPYSMWKSYLLENISCNSDTNLQIKFHALDFVTCSSHYPGHLQCQSYLLINNDSN